MKKLLASTIFVALIGCETAPREEVQDRTDVAPGFTEAQIVDVAVLPAEADAPDREILQGRIRSTAHQYLIDVKNFAVPENGYVDRAIGTLPGATEPSRAAEAAGADAALLVSINQWETEDLLPKGRIYAGGTLLLQGKGQTWWQRTFRNRTLLAPRTVTASNRAEIVDGMVRDLTRDLLSTLPAKPRR
jgi:hypothetical protein